jgi:uncharacterized membrane protein YkoI
MKKIIVVFILAIAALNLTACAGGAAEAFDHSGYIPETAESVETERDDGFTKTTYRDQDGSEYELYVDQDNNVRVMKYDSERDSTATEVALTAEEAFAFVTAVYPNARLIASDSDDDDDGGREWTVLFADGDIIGEYELDAATGDVLEYTLFYGVTAETDPLSVITGSYPGAEIVHLDLSMDDGRLEYDGEARMNGDIYEFTVDVDSGKLIEWEQED